MAGLKKWSWRGMWQTIFAHALMVNLLFIGGLVQARSILYFHPGNTVDVREAPDEDAEIIGTLEVGERAPMSRSSYGAFRKIIFIDGGRKKLGYILQRDIEEDDIIDEASHAERKVENLGYLPAQRGGYGLGLSFSMNQQGSRALQTSGGTYEIDSLTGSTINYFIFADSPINSEYKIRYYLGFRKVLLEGEGTTEGATSSLAGFDILIEQEFLSVGFFLRKYGSAISSWWFGGGVELAAPQSVLTNIGGVKEDTTDSAPTFYFVSLGAGRDFKYKDNFYFYPEIRIGGVANSNPTILVTDFILSGRYDF